MSLALIPTNFFRLQFLIQSVLVTWGVERNTLYPGIGKSGIVRWGIAFGE
jgi:hypothetical protein